MSIHKGSKEEKLTGEKHLLYKEPAVALMVPNVLINEYSLYLSNFEEKPDNISRLYHELNSVTPEDRIKLIINSDGGLITEGKTIINAIDSTNAAITTIIPSRAYSMGSVLFCTGEKRVVYEHSNLIYHNYSGGSFCKGGEMKDHVKFMKFNLESFFKSYVIGLTDEEFQKLFDGKDYWFNTEDMCKRGIATHVSIEGLLIPAKKYLKILKKSKKAAKAKGYKIQTLLEGLRYEIDEISEYFEEILNRQMSIQQAIIELAEELNE